MESSLHIDPMPVSLARVPIDGVLKRRVPYAVFCRHRNQPRRPPPAKISTRIAHEAAASATLIFDFLAAPS